MSNRPLPPELQNIQRSTTALSPEDAAMLRRQREQREGIRGIISTILLIVGAILCALLINKFLFQSYEVDGHSMEPTLKNLDRLIIVKAPRTWAKITRHQYVPARGDIIVLKRPGLESEQLIKRVIGLPGETVVVANGTITIYNEQHPEGFRPDDADYGDALPKTDGTVTRTVGKKEVFVAGDNRAPGRSLDSRSSVIGNVPLDNIVGKNVFRLFPIGDIRTF